MGEFERLTAELCDELRAAHDSWRHLEDLDRLQLVTSSMDLIGAVALIFAILLFGVA